MTPVCCASFTDRVSQITTLRLSVINNFFKLPGQLLVLVYLRTLFVELISILRMIVHLGLVIAMFFIVISLHHLLHMLTIEDILVSLLLQFSLALLGLRFEVTSHLPLGLAIKLLCQIFIDTILRETWKIRNLLLKLLTSQLLLSFAKILSSNALHSFVLRDSHSVSADHGAITVACQIVRAVGRNSGLTIDISRLADHKLI